MPDSPAPPDPREILRAFALAVQREVCVRCGFLPAKAPDEEMLRREGPVEPAELRVIRALTSIGHGSEEGYA